MAEKDNASYALNRTAEAASGLAQVAIPAARIIGEPFIGYARFHGPKATRFLARMAYYEWYVREEDK